MSILWRGGEDIDFYGAVVSTTSGHFRAGYARCEILSGVAPAVARKSFGPCTSLWFTGRVYFGAGGLDSYTLIGAGDNLPAWDKTLWIITNASKQLCVNSPSSGVWASSTFIPSGLVRLDVQIVGFGEATTTVRVWADGALIIDQTAALSITGLSAFTNLKVFGSGLYGWGGASEMIVADEDLRLWSLVTLAPTGAGDANTFTGGAYTDIDEITLSDADAAYSDTAEQDLQVALSNLPAGDFVVKDVTVKARMSDGVGGIGMQIGIKTNGAVHLGSTIVLAGAWETDEQSFVQNPETVNVFSLSEINALQLAFRSKAA